MWRGTDVLDEDALSELRLTPDKSRAYGGHADQVVDFLLPGGGAGSGGGQGGEGKALVVLLHGGFWRPAYDRQHTALLARALADEGYLVAVPEYRRTTGWPEIFDDVAVCVESLPMMTAALGFRPNRTVLVGHSAGGHLALWAAARHRLPAGSPWRTESRPDAVVSLAGCASLRLADEWRLGGGAAHDMMGGSVDALASRYADCDPAAQLPLGVPVTLVHGVDDVVVPVTMSREYARMAREAGEEVRLVELPDMEHYGLIDPSSSAWPHVRSALEA
ncbi:alpha/beta hydrolase [Streptacidiphilus sp. NEAU-YB345]|uniref:Alpha/beta hydrolase n=1 Tax=Streptacidiphilus fuscans TaxID=2789292 RepID=A0A931BAA9_9ACTN|nr:alpha/beta hydrolase [Streptacidiphilus fuscans]MBF9073033.1 alpha/beta hydrolase [Streptacidiphilus fuscans]